MSDEIKEILDRLDYNEWEVDLYKVPITWSEMYDIRDYITNLQKENKRLKRLAEKDYTELNIAEMNATIYKSRCKKAIEKLEEIPKINKLYINNELQYNLEEEKKVPKIIPEALFEEYTRGAKIYQLYKTVSEIIEYLDYLKSKGE